MTEAEDEELENDEETYPFVYEHIEISDDEIHDEYEGDYDEAKEIGRYVAPQYVSIKCKHGSKLVCC
jgi:hypothetical protein